MNLRVGVNSACTFGSSIGAVFWQVFGKRKIKILLWEVASWINSNSAHCFDLYKMKYFHGGK